MESWGRVLGPQHEGFAWKYTSSVRFEYISHPFFLSSLPLQKAPEGLGKTLEIKLELHLKYFNFIYNFIFDTLKL